MNILVQDLQQKRRDVRKARVDIRDLRKRAVQRYQIACSGRTEIDAADQTLEVGNLFQQKPELVSKHRVGEFADSGKARLNLTSLDQWSNKPRPQQPCAHAGDGFVQDIK